MILLSKMLHPVIMFVVRSLFCVSGMYVTRYECMLNKLFYSSVLEFCERLEYLIVKSYSLNYLVVKQSLL